MLSERSKVNTDEEFLDRVIGNPIHAYKMMKRFSVDWSKMEKHLEEDHWSGKNSNKDLS